MSKQLQPIEESTLHHSMIIIVEPEDVGRVVEFWINNVLLKHPVRVDFVSMSNTGALRINCTPIVAKPDQTDKAGES